MTVRVGSSGVFSSTVPAREVAADDAVRQVVARAERLAEVGVVARPPVLGRARRVVAERVAPGRDQEVAGKAVHALVGGRRRRVQHDALAARLQAVDQLQQRPQRHAALAAAQAGVVDAALDLDQVGGVLLAPDVGSVSPSNQSELWTISAPGSSRRICSMNSAM